MEHENRKCSRPESTAISKLAPWPFSGDSTGLPQTLKCYLAEWAYIERTVHREEECGRQVRIKGVSFDKNNNNVISERLSLGVENVHHRVQLFLFACIAVDWLVQGEPEKVFSFKVWRFRSKTISHWGIVTATYMRSSITMMSNVNFNWFLSIVSKHWESFSWFEKWLRNRENVDGKGGGGR